MNILCINDLNSRGRFSLLKLFTGFFQARDLGDTPVDTGYNCLRFGVR